MVLLRRGSSCRGQELDLIAVNVGLLGIKAPTVDHVSTINRELSWFNLSF